MNRSKVADRLAAFKSSVDALALEISPQQLDFVPDAKTCPAYAFAYRATQKAYILTDKDRSIGLLVLEIDAKKASSILPMC
ncbi:MAG: hypothetical protein PHT58_08655 [Eubacteriales bacterium]|nr:hypothetical protein [Eubacteriales bacterium]